MQLKCSRYVFIYTSPPDIVEDFILRSDDLASQTYGRDKHFSRLNQVLEQARFLGWPLPRFGSELPEDLLEIPPAGIDHIFENQAKLLVDVAPTTRVMLEDGRFCPIKMVCSTTAAGDLVWRCHLLLDTDGTPYVQRNDKKYRVKLKGTKLVCQTETLPYDEKYVFECFGGDEGVFPVPFLPEFFSDRPIAQKFSPEGGVVEVVFIQEETPVKVLANEIVPFYRPLEINYAKALTSTDEEFDSNVNSLVEGWDDLKENEKIDIEKDDEIASDEIDEMGGESVKLINIIASFSKNEEDKFHEYEKILADIKISSKAEADEFRKDPEKKEQAEKWLLAAVNRLRIIANSANKIGAVIDLINKHLDQQILIIQPRPKWAAKLAQILTQREIKCQIFDQNSADQINKFYEGKIDVLIASDSYEDLLVDDLVIISVSAIKSLKWLNLLNSSQQVYCITIKQLGYNDFNYISEHDNILVESKEYNGPSLDILKLESGEEVKETESSNVVETEKKSDKVTRPKFKIKIAGQGQGRPKTASTYEKALELAKKQELDGKKCEIYGPDNAEDALYISGIGDVR